MSLNDDHQVYYLHLFRFLFFHKNGLCLKVIPLIERTSCFTSCLCHLLRSSTSLYLLCFMVEIVISRLPIGPAIPTEESYSLVLSPRLVLQKTSFSTNTKTHWPCIYLLSFRFSNSTPLNSSPGRSSNICGFVASSSTSDSGFLWRWGDAVSWLLWSIPGRRQSFHPHPTQRILPSCSCLQVPPANISVARL